MIGGLMFSQLITLFLTPVVYTYMAPLLEWWRKRRVPAIEHIGSPDRALTMVSK